MAIQSMIPLATGMRMLISCEYVTKSVAVELPGRLFMTSSTDSKIIFWTVLIPMVVTQLPTFSSSSETLGNCVDIESQLNLLGGQTQPSTDGLIPRNLLVVAQDDHSPSDEYYTTQRPEVVVHSAKITCGSDTPFRNNTFGTVSLLVNYSCRGVACQQRPSEVRSMLYLHQFAFVCETRSNSFTLYSQIAGYAAPVQRSTTNRIHDTVVADAGSCRRCGINPSPVANYDRLTGCFSMLIT